MSAPKMLRLERFWLPAVAQGVWVGIHLALSRHLAVVAVLAFIGKREQARPIPGGEESDGVCEFCG